VDRMSATPLRVGDWRVEPDLGQIRRNNETVRLETRTMRLLVCLAERAGEVVSLDQLLSDVWSGVVVTPDSVYQAIKSLRRTLGDDSKQPTYIATVPKLGYRLIAPVRVATDEGAAFALGSTATDAAVASTAGAARKKTGRRLLAWGLACVAAVAVSGMVAYRHGAAIGRSVPPKSVAVLPFLDLTTQEMTEEYFADGMTEELINKLAKNPALRVPAPTASFFYKGKQVPLATIGQALGVTYLLDGSVRKSELTMRISARLVRAEDGYVLWSETYDRPGGDRLKVQDEIAGAVSASLSNSIR